MFANLFHFLPHYPVAIFPNMAYNEFKNVGVYPSIETFLSYYY